MSGEQVQIVPAYFGENNHKFTILSYNDDRGKRTEYFILKEFEDYIGIKFSRRSIKRNCPGRICWGDIRGAKGVAKGYPLSGYYDQPDAILLPEPNFYKLLLRSNNPRSDPIVDWACDVLKEIRDKGFYIMPGVNIPQALPETQDQHHTGEMERVNKMTDKEKVVENRFKRTELNATKNPNRSEGVKNGWIGRGAKKNMKFVHRDILNIRMSSLENQVEELEIKLEEKIQTIEDYQLAYGPL